MRNAEDVIISNSDIAGDVDFQDGKRLLMHRNRHGDTARAHDAALSRPGEASRPSGPSHDLHASEGMSVANWIGLIGVIVAAAGVVATIVF